MKLFKTWYNHPNAGAYDGELNTGVSLAIPDQTLTIPEMMARHARGLTFDQKVAVYNEVDPFNGRDPKTLDLSEIEDMRTETINRMKEATNKARLDADAAAAAKRKAEVDEAIKEHLRSSQQQKNEGEQPE